MPNAVYEHTRSALTGLLPRRAATSVLDRALRHHARSADDIDGEQMARVLQDGVYRELRGLVPDPGLTRTLQRLARDALRLSEPPSSTSPVLLPEARTPSPATAAGPAREASLRTADVPADDRTEPPTEVATEPPTEVATEHPTGLRTEPPTDALAEPRADPRTEPPTDALAEPPSEVASELPSDLDMVATLLAGLDGVQAVGLFDAVGRPLDVRGALIDPTALGGLVVAGASLLERGDQLRSIVVDAPRGRLVAVPVRPRWLALTGTADLNLGAVYAALNALEEER